MKVQIRLYAGLHDMVGERDLTLELADNATIEQLRDRLAQEYPVVTPFLSTLVCAVDEEFVPADHPLHDGDAISLIPPVSGGADDDGLFEITSEPIDPLRLTDAVRKDESGAIALFSGVARNHSEGRKVCALEYDAYPALAEKKLREVAEEARARWPLTGIGILHRTGRIAIGETSLLVAVSAAHRREAFEACHYAVDRIKQIVPIWKKEIWEDGAGEWVAGHPVDVPEQVKAKPSA